MAACLFAVSFSQKQPGFLECDSDRMTGNMWEYETVQEAWREEQLAVPKPLCTRSLFQESFERVSHSHMLLVINSECGNLQGHLWKENESLPVVRVTNWCRYVCPLSSLICERTGEGRKALNTSKGMLRI